MIEIPAEKVKENKLETKQNMMQKIGSFMIKKLEAVKLDWEQKPESSGNWEAKENHG